MTSRYVGWFSDPELSEIAGIAKSGANSVAMGPYCVMSHWNAPNVGSMVGTTTQFLQAMSAARARGLKVVLKPIIDCSSYAGDLDTAGWRAAINPSNIASWIQDYWAKCFQPFLAHVDVVAIHTELATVSALYPNNFIELIEEIRMAGFSGPITTSNDLDPLGCRYWTALDWIGADAYPAIRSKSMADAVADWTSLAQQAAVVNTQTGCNIYFGEFCPNIGVSMSSAQAAVVYQAFWEVFGPLEFWAGVIGWRWPQNGSAPSAVLTAGLATGLAARPTFVTPLANLAVGSMYVGQT